MKIIRTTAAIAIVLAVASCAGKKSDQAAAPQEDAVNTVSTAQTVMREVPQEETYSTNVEAYVTNNIAPQATGRIKKINVEIGDFVRAGQVLAVMDRVNLEQQKLKLANDSTELARLKELYRQGGLSQSDFEASELSYKVAKSTYDNLVENTILRSPVNGVVTARNYDKGDMFSMGQPIFVVQQIVPVKLLVAVSESDYTKVKKGDRAKITADALPGAEFTGRVNRIYPTMDATTHTFQAEILVDNASRKLRPGMYAKVTMTFAVNNSIVIPDEAVVKQQGSGQRSVYVVKDDSTVESRIVTLGRHMGGEYEILSGLSENETIVTKGQAALQNGSKVQVTE